MDSVIEWINQVIFVLLGVSTLIGIADFIGFLPPKIRRYFRLNRTDEVLETLKELKVDIKQIEKANIKMKNPVSIKKNDIKKAVDETLVSCKINKKVTVGRQRPTTLPYYYDVAGKTCGSGGAKYFAKMLSSMYRCYVNEGDKNLEKLNYDFVVASKVGSPILGYEFSKIVEKPFVLCEEHRRLELRNDMREYFNCESIPPKGGRALIIDDSTTGGGRICDVAKKLRSYGYTVESCLVVFEPRNKDARNVLRENGIELYSVTQTHME